MLTIDKVSDYSLESLPTLFKAKPMVEKFLQDPPLRQKSKLKFWPHLESVMGTETFSETVYYSFWLIFTVAFKPHLEVTTERLISKLREVSKVLNIKFLKSKYKEELQRYYEFVTAYIVHLVMFHVFKQDEDKVTHPRFILNCYHIVLFQTRGILLSDYFIQNQLETIFTPEAFLYLNQEARIKKKLRMSETNSVFDMKMGKFQAEAANSLNNAIIFPKFNKLRSDFKELHQQSAQRVFDKLRYDIIDYNETRAALMATNKHTPYRPDGNSIEISESTNLRPIASTGSVFPLPFKANLLISPLRKLEAEDVGLAKVRPNVYRMNLPCNKVSPAIEKDFAMPLKVNLKSHLKKTLHMTLIQDNKHVSKNLNKLKAMARSSSSAMFGITKLDKLDSSMPSDIKLEYSSAKPKEKLRQSVNYPEKKRRSFSVKNFVKGYEDFIDMNAHLKHAKVESFVRPTYTPNVYKKRF